MDVVLPRPPCPVLAELLAIVAELERLEAQRRERLTDFLRLPQPGNAESAPGGS